MAKKIKPIFKKSVGKNKRRWNNLKRGTVGPVICQLCGTEWPERPDESYILGSFLGLKFVEECCGAAVDVLYEEFGEEFTIAFLQDFAENPSDERFGFLRFMLPEIFEKARQKTEEISREIKTAQRKLSTVK